MRVKVGRDANLIFLFLIYHILIYFIATLTIVTIVMFIRVFSMVTNKLCNVGKIANLLSVSKQTV